MNGLARDRARTRTSFRFAVPIAFLLIAVSMIALPGASAIGLVSLSVQGVASGSVTLTGSTTTINATFDAPADASKTTFSLGNGTKTYDVPAAICNGDRCSTPGVPVDWSAKRPVTIWVTYDGTSFYQQRTVTVEPDTTPPTVSSVSFDFSNPSSITFSATDPSGVASYQLVRDGSRIASGSGSGPTLTKTVELADQLKQGEQASFTLTVTDAFGNAAVKSFGGTVITTPPQIASIQTAATLASGIGYLSFEISGNDIDLGSVGATIGSKRYPASCSGTTDPSCLVTVDHPAAGTPVSVTVSAADTFGNTATKQATVVFAPDTTPPVFDRIASDYEGYNASESYSAGSFFIEFNESGSIDPSDVIAQVTPQGGSAQRVSATKCWTVSQGTIRCSFPLSGPATVAYWSAQDRAGNRAIVKSGYITSRRIGVDRTPPQVTTLAIQTSGTLTQSDHVVLAAPGTIRIVAEVTAEGSRVTRAKVTSHPSSGGSSSSTYAVSCQLISAASKIARCTSDPIQISGDTRLTIDLYDASGTPYEASKAVTIGASTGVGATGWDVSSVTAHPDVYLPDGSLPITIEAQVASTVISSSIGLAGASVKSCTGLDAPLASANGNAIVITGFANGNELGSGGSGSCTVTVSTERGGALDSATQDLVINFTLTPINAAGLENLAAYNASRASSALALHSVLSTAKQVESYANIMCTAYKTTNDASKAVNVAAVALGGDSQVSPIGAILSALGGTLFSGVKSISPYADPLCGVVQCAIPIDKKGDTLQSEVMSVYKPIEGNVISEINSISPFPIVSSESTTQRVEDSFILSTMTACVPGIIDNLDKINQIECGQQLCLLEVQTGDFKGSASLCSYAHSMQVCGYLGDQLFAIVPFGPMSEQLLGNVGTAIQRPLAIAAGWGLDLLSQAVPSVRVVLSTNLQNLIGDIYHQTAGGSPVSMTPPNYCQQLAQYQQSHHAHLGGSS